jgi:hypothetical protein
MECSIPTTLGLRWYWSGCTARAISSRQCFRTGRRFPDTPQGLQPDGFSVHPPSHRRESPKALSAP